MQISKLSLFHHCETFYDYWFDCPSFDPFDDELALDQDKFNALAKRLLDTGCSGLAPFGTTGEALSVSHSERKTALEGLVAAGIDPSVMIQVLGCAICQIRLICAGMRSILMLA